MKRLTIIFILLSFSCVTDKQLAKPIKIVEYEYIANHAYGVVKKFKTTRKFLNTSDFMDGVLCSCDTCKICNMKFIGAKKQWFIWNGNKWKMFYDKRAKSNHEIRFKQKTLTFLKTYYGTDTLYSFKYRDNDVDFSTDNSEYLFSPVKGVVVVKAVGVYFTRNDYDSSWLKFDNVSN